MVTSSPSSLVISITIIISKLHWTELFRCRQIYLLLPQLLLFIGRICQITSFKGDLSNENYDFLDGFLGILALKTLSARAILKTVRYLFVATRKQFLPNVCLDYSIL